MRCTCKQGDWLSVADVARLLNVSRGYVRKKLMRKHVLRPVIVRRGRKFALRGTVERYHRMHQRIGLKALREMACVQQEAGAYDIN
ncbi:helix-turn-helix domain-containing protein [Trinickia violacea]|uniref:helix-turn-helix domain-containing protein n=1 Tax=Trinickia violacea TaxID=2571746 RepID=UPI0026902A3E